MLINNNNQNPDGDGEPFVARVEAMLQYPGEAPVVRVQWMYRAPDTGTHILYPALTAPPCSSAFRRMSHDVVTPPSKMGR